MIDEDTWATIDNFPGYEVNYLGQVRSWLKLGPEPGLAKEPRLLAPIRDKKSAAWCVQMTNGQKWSRKSVACLVLNAFGTPRPSARAKVVYLDGDGDNLTISNLIWRSDNNCGAATPDAE